MFCALAVLREAALASAPAVSQRISPSDSLVSGKAYKKVIRKISNAKLSQGAHEGAIFTIKSCSRKKIK